MNKFLNADGLTHFWEKIKAYAPNPIKGAVTQEEFDAMSEEKRSNGVWAIVGEDNGYIGGGSIPSGIIVSWSGESSTIPTGWALCDGSNGTPDLRNRFVFGAGGWMSAGNVGGEESNTIEISNLPFYQSIGSSGGGGSSGSTINSVAGSPYNPTNTPATLNNMPPYYALCFIMKL